MHPLADLKGVGPALANALSKHGISTAEQIASASVEEITAVPGIGPARARMLISAATALHPAERPPRPKAEKVLQKKSGKTKKKKGKKIKLDAKKKNAKASKAEAEKSKKTEKKKKS